MGAVVALTTTASIVSAADPKKSRVTIRNVDSTIIVYVGGSGVTSAGVAGMSLHGGTAGAGESITLETSAAVYAVAASGTPNVRVLAEFDE